MISYIKGTLEYIGAGFIIVDNNGIGYNIQVSAMTQARLDKRGEVKVYTYMNVREDNISLFGFLSFDELELFSKLITVSGVGPKGAIAILDCASVAEIKTAIAAEDIKLLSMGQGIGKKTAQRIALELKDKIKLTEGEKIIDVQNITQTSSEKSEALEALTALGFTRSEALTALAKVPDMQDSQKIISLALKSLSKD